MLAMPAVTVLRESRVMKVSASMNSFQQKMKTRMAAVTRLGAARGAGSYAGRSMLDRATIGFQSWTAGRSGSGAVTSLAPASAMAGKVTPVWRSAGRGG